MHLPPVMCQARHRITDLARRDTTFWRVFFVRLEPRKPGIIMSQSAITVSRIDMDRIEALLERLPAAEADKLEALRAELDRADGSSRRPCRRIS
ncbi:hypothetical protein RLIN73S_04398 [Rhodanobacter lindaniclasticus]